jgi:hypothetical protein
MEAKVNFKKNIIVICIFKIKFKLNRIKLDWIKLLFFSYLNQTTCDFIFKLDDYFTSKSIQTIPQTLLIKSTSGLTKTLWKFGLRPLCTPEKEKKNLWK